MLTLESLIQLLAPHLCIGCGKEGKILCLGCSLEGFSPVPERCYRCFSLSQDARVCTGCRRHSPLAYVWVRTAYDALAKKLLYKLKFERARAAALPMGLLMEEVLPYGGTDRVVVPVPTASRRVRQRGYDHAALIARVVAKERGLPLCRTLRRLGNTRQVGASRTLRQTQLRDAFYCADPQLVTGKDVLLVDDIVTTGASLECAAKVLRQSGARSVSALVFAQKQ